MATGGSCDFFRIKRELKQKSMLIFCCRKLGNISGYKRPPYSAWKIVTRYIVIVHLAIFPRILISPEICRNKKHDRDSNKKQPLEKVLSSGYPCTEKIPAGYLVRVL